MKELLRVRDEAMPRLDGLTLERSDLRLHIHDTYANFLCTT